MKRIDPNTGFPCDLKINVSLMSEYYLCTTIVVKWRFPRQSPKTQFVGKLA